MFKSFEYFTSAHTMTTANGTTALAIGEGNLGNRSRCTRDKEVSNSKRCTYAWYLPLRKSYASLRLPNTVFESRTNKECVMKFEGGRDLLIGKRYVYGGS